MTSKLFIPTHFPQKKLLWIKPKLLDAINLEIFVVINLTFQKSWRMKIKSVILTRVGFFKTCSDS